ncbi:MAG: hypothetical protein ACRDD7_14650 [Peptostreptococcaceae bacterium]
MNNLYELTNYTIDSEYIISRYIREYDISKANINILYKYKKITVQEYETYMNMDNMQRKISIGLLLQRNPEYTQILKDGITEAKKMFFISNNIQPSEVLSIKNDAIFLIDKIATFTDFDNIKFVNKNIYTSFYKLNKMQLYYYYDSITGNEVLDIKGMNDEKRLLHENHFLEFLKVCFNSAQSSNIMDTLDIVSTFYNKYLQLGVDIEYYRNFDSDSMYITKNNNYGIYSNLSNDNKNDLNIMCNLHIIRQLYQIYSGIYFMRK